LQRAVVRHFRKPIKFYVQRCDTQQDEQYHDDFDVSFSHFFIFGSWSAPHFVSGRFPIILYWLRSENFKIEPQVS
jgi:hypothetical protein